MSWNILLIRVLNNFWYFKHQILTRICPEGYSKHYLRSFLLFSYKFSLNMLLEQILIEIWCLKYQALFKTLITSRFQGTCAGRAHKTATVCVCVGGGQISHNIPLKVPNNLGLTKSTIAKYSLRLFCKGVPVRIMRLLVLIRIMAILRADLVFFKMWPSSQMTKSGPGSTRHSMKTSFCFFLNFLAFSFVRFRNMS